MERTGSGRLWALVLAGGDGTRLQALTRLLTGVPIPKQYCRILGDRSLLETTLDRIAPLVPREQTLVVINRAHLDLALPQLASVPPANVLAQPQNLDTGPGLVVSLGELARRDPGATVAIFPSDHDVRATARFRRAVTRMSDLVERHPERIALLGVRPDEPDTGFGYIAPGHRLDRATEAFRVVAFHEKPTREVALQIIRRGGLWNSFVMVGRVARFLELVREIRPDGAADTPWNFSTDFLGRVPQHLFVVPGEALGWSDWGTPEAIERTFAAMGLIPSWHTPQRATG